ncbi:MAG: hypothetical protein FWE84_03580 [Firmicutes bacterium]|nr:hypothetical protein [Bacillota bacterium]
MPRFLNLTDNKNAINAPAKTPVALIKDKETRDYLKCRSRKPATNHDRKKEQRRNGQQKQWKENQPVQ